MTKLTVITLRIIFLLAAFCLVGRALTNDGVERLNSRGLADLGWMSGDWQTNSSQGPISEEHWTKPSAGSMIGMSRTLRGDRTVSFEFLRLEQRGDSIYYIASPDAKCPATDFKLTRLADQEAVFENAENDFPKRIIYKRHAKGELTATIDGGEGTKSRAFPYQAMSR